MRSIPELERIATKNDYYIDKSRSQGDNPRYIIIGDFDHDCNLTALPLILDLVQKGDELNLEGGEGFIKKTFWGVYRIDGTKKTKLYSQKEWASRPVPPIFGYFPDDLERLLNRGVSIRYTDSNELIRAHDSVDLELSMNIIDHSSEATEMLPKIMARFDAINDERSRTLVKNLLASKAKMAYQVAGVGHLNEIWYASLQESKEHYATLIDRSGKYTP